MITHEETVVADFEASLPEAAPSPDSIPTTGLDSQGFHTPPGLLPYFSAEPEGGFPNPWLWPTDAALGGGPSMPSTFQAAPGEWLTQQPFGAEDDAANHHSQGQRMAPRLGRRQHQQAVEEDDLSGCRWHKSAETVGVISDDGHVFTKTAGPRRSRVSERGARMDLASICMVFDASLRRGGIHKYCYQIMDGELGAADGAGFVFDSKVRRNNIQRMRSVFLNQRGRICLRNNQQVTKLHAQLPPLTVGSCLTLFVDLDSLIARFNITDAQGVPTGSADVSLHGLFDASLGGTQLRSGFFCAVVTGNITIGIS